MDLPVNLCNLAKKTVSDFAAEFNGKDPVEVNLNNVIDAIKTAKQISNGYVPQSEFTFDGKTKKIEKRDTAYYYLDKSDKSDRYSEFNIAKVKVKGEQDTYCMVGAETGAAS